MAEFITVLLLLLEIYSYIIIIYVLIGYFPEARGSKIYQFLETICQPLLNIFRFANVQNMSFAPILAIILLNFISFLLRSIYL